MRRNRVSWATCLKVMMMMMTSGGFAQPDTLWTSQAAMMRNNNTETVQRSDGGFAVGGHYPLTWRNGEQPRVADCFYLVLTDSMGVATDSTFYVSVPAQDTANAYMRDMLRCRDGGYFMVGANGGGTGQAIRTDSDGVEVWRSYFIGNRDLSSLLACGLGEGDTLMVACRNNLAKLSPDGEVVWVRQFENLVYTSNILLLADFGYYITGFTSEIGNGSDDIYAARVDRNGRLIWENSYGTEFSEVCGGTTVTVDGGLCIAGTQRFGQNGGDICPVLVRIDEDGNQIWIHVIDEFGGQDSFTSIVQTADGGFAAAGQSGSLVIFGTMYYLLRVNSEGEILWRTGWGTRSNNCRSLLLLEDGGYLLGGYGGFNEFDRGAWLVRTEPDTTRVNGVRLLDPTLPSLIALELPYPNPFNATTTIRFSAGSQAAPTRLAVYGLDGRLVATLSAAAALSVAAQREAVTHGGMTADGIAVWNAAGFPAGEYFVRLQAGREEAVRKVVLVK